MIPYTRHTITPDDEAAVRRALHGPTLTGGPEVEAFEAALGTLTGARHAVAVASGTAALHLAYTALGVGPTGTLITSPISFVATANAAHYCGTAPLFADVNPHTGLMDPLALRRAMPSAPVPVRAVVPVHLGGQAVPLDRLGIAPDAVCIEDACHALGATWTDLSGVSRAVGSCSHSAAAVFSFHPAKQVACGEGGAILTNRDSLAQTLRELRNHGRATPDSQAAVLGYNYRMPAMSAALGASQLRRLPESVAERRRLAARYDEAFGDVAYATPVPHDRGSARHLYQVLLKPYAFRPDVTRADVLTALRHRGIGAQVHYLPIHLLPLYRQLDGWTDGAFPLAEAFGAWALTLPLYPGLTAAEQGQVIGTVHTVCEEYGR